MKFITSRTVIKGKERDIEHEIGECVRNRDLGWGGNELEIGNGIGTEKGQEIEG